jgi:hypothetical protein
MIKDCVSQADFTKMKTKVLVNHYKLDSAEQYSRREKIRIGNFEPSGDLIDGVIDMLNHIVRVMNQQKIVNHNLYLVALMAITVEQIVNNRLYLSLGQTSVIVILQDLGMARRNKLL